MSATEPEGTAPAAAATDPAPGVRTYRGRAVAVSFEAALCKHAAECVGGLPQVFDPGRRPWITPDAAGADRVAEVVDRCPSGALQYRLAAPGDTEETRA
ncbi:(4Fe-4S)-binding protein [Streptomyces spiramenti]|uniref:Divergent 4Fe-4S mono-cluster domain-containing protein n=1 Tax=Streptomyces spiramenti TaxID=2720606 RepID=A0ABX1AJ98_9ACTN|nr:(4Fe-4S)-binding protein [Streptomyces spiramenti]NJP65473.1 hypothetical protein [Streptomyces spiramenti]